MFDFDNDYMDCVLEEIESKQELTIAGHNNEIGGTCDETDYINYQLEQLYEGKIGYYETIEIQNLEKRLDEIFEERGIK